MRSIYLSLFLTVLSLYPTKAATSYPATGLSSCMALLEQRLGVRILDFRVTPLPETTTINRSPLRPTTPFGRNKNNQPESATLHRSVQEEEQGSSLAWYALLLLSEGSTTIHSDSASVYCSVRKQQQESTADIYALQLRWGGTRTIHSDSATLYRPTLEKLQLRIRTEVICSDPHKLVSNNSSGFPPDLPSRPDGTRRRHLCTGQSGCFAPDE